MTAATIGARAVPCAGCSEASRGLSGVSERLGALADLIGLALGEVVVP